MSAQLRTARLVRTDGMLPAMMPSRTCCEDAALAVVEGRALSSAAAAAARCFSRTLYPRAAKPTVARLVRCVRDLLRDDSY